LVFASNGLDPKAHLSINLLILNRYNLKRCR